MIVVKARAWPGVAPRFGGDAGQGKGGTQKSVKSVHSLQQERKLVVEKMVRPAGIEPASEPWKGSILATRLWPPISACGRSVEGWNPHPSGVILCLSISSPQNWVLRVLLAHTDISVEGSDLVSGAIIPSRVVRHSAVGNESVDMTHPFEVEKSLMGISVEGLNLVLQVLSLGRVVRRSAIGNISTQREPKWTVQWKGWVLICDLQTLSWEVFPHNAISFM